MSNRLISRRQLLLGGAITVASYGLGPRFLFRPARAQHTAKRVLVAIFQRGAVDGLNMVVPYAEPRYYDSRSSIAIPPPNTGDGGGIDLDGQFALHPAMGELMPFFNARELALVHACGSPDPTRSHFDAQDYMETGFPGVKNATDGWLNRHLLVTSPGASSVFRAVALGGALPRALAGGADVLAVASLDQLSLGSGQTGVVAQAAIDRMYGSRTDLLGGAVQDALGALGRLDPGAYQPRNGAEYPTAPLGAQLREIAQVIRADVGLEVAFLDVGGWDTHSLQGGSNGQLAALLGEFVDGLVAFRTDLGDEFEDVCVLTMSEFGRTLKENGAGGTDHGRGTAMLVLGGTVAGGAVYGDWPGLEDDALFEGRDLAVTTDFRTLFAEVIDRHLGNPNIDGVFPGFAYDSSSLGVIA